MRDEAERDDLDDLYNEGKLYANDDNMSVDLDPMVFDSYSQSW